MSTEAMPLDDFLKQFDERVVEELSRRTSLGAEEVRQMLTRWLGTVRSQGFVIVANAPGVPELPPRLSAQMLLAIPFQPPSGLTIEDTILAMQEVRVDRDTPMITIDSLGYLRPPLHPQRWRPGEPRLPSFLRARNERHQDAPKRERKLRRR